MTCYNRLADNPRRKAMLSSNQSELSFVYLFSYEFMWFHMNLWILMADILHTSCCVISRSLICCANYSWAKIPHMSPSGSSTGSCSIYLFWYFTTRVTLTPYTSIPRTAHTAAPGAQMIPTTNEEAVCAESIPISPQWSLFGRMINAWLCLKGNDHLAGYVILRISERSLYPESDWRTGIHFNSIKRGSTEALTM